MPTSLRALEQFVLRLLAVRLHLTYGVEIVALPLPMPLVAGWSKAVRDARSGH